MKKTFSLFLLVSIFLSVTGCRCTNGDAGIYDVVVVGGGPAGIGAALAAASAGARTALLERDSRIGGTTVQAEVCDIGLFYAWRRQIIAGPAWAKSATSSQACRAYRSTQSFSRQLTWCSVMPFSSIQRRVS